MRCCGNFSLALKKDHFECFERVYKNVNDINLFWNKETYEEASRKGNIKILKFMLDNHWKLYNINDYTQDSFWDSETSKFALNFETLKFLNDNGCPWDKSAFIQALGFHSSSIDMLDIVKYLHTNGCPWDSEVFTEAASLGRLDIIRYFHENGCEWNGCVSSAFYNPQSSDIELLDIIKYFEDNKCPYGIRFPGNAIRTGRIEIVKYMVDKYYMYPEIYCEVCYTNFECYKYYDDNVNTNKDLSGVILNNITDIEIFKHFCQKWYSENKTSNILSKFLIQLTGIPNKFEYFKYLHEFGCPLNKDLIHSCLSKGNVKCIKYLTKNGYGLEIKEWDYVLSFKFVENIKLYKFLHKIGYVFDTDKIKWSKINNVECLRYLVNIYKVNPLLQFLTFYYNKCISGSLLYLMVVDFINGGQDYKEYVNKFDYYIYKLSLFRKLTQTQTFLRMPVNYFNLIPNDINRMVEYYIYPFHNEIENK